MVVRSCDDTVVNVDGDGFEFHRPCAALGIAAFRGRFKHGTIKSFTVFYSPNNPPI